MMLMMGLMWIVPVLLIGAVVYAIGGRLWPDGKQSAHLPHTPAEILKARFARGEISQDEYDQIRHALEG